MVKCFCFLKLHWLGVFNIKVLIFLFDHFLEGRPKNVKNFVGFLEYGEKPQFLFEIYWPLQLVSCMNFKLFIRGEKRKNRKIENGNFTKLISQYLFLQIHFCILSLLQSCQTGKECPLMTSDFRVGGPKWPQNRTL